MQATWHPATTPLKGVLAGVWHVAAARDAPLVAKVLPDNSTCLVFRLDSGDLRSGDDGGRPWSPASISGPRVGPLDITLDPGARILIAQVHAAGASPLLGVPMATLADRYEPAHAVLGREAGSVMDDLAARESVSAQVRAIEAWVGQRVRAFEPRRGRVAEAALVDRRIDVVARLAASMPIADLADRVGLSRRHLGRLAHEHLGFSPKAFGRIARFDRAVKLARARPGDAWGRLAAAAGYADQAHLTRDFVAIGGIRPGELRGPRAALIW